MKRHIIASLALTACSVIGFAPLASAVQWTEVVVGDETGIAYQIDLDSRRTVYSKTGWKHITFFVLDSKNRRPFEAIASCSPYQVKVDSYGWDWAPNDATSYSADTVGGKISRAACNW
jgi:hypothetical protein